MLAKRRALALSAALAAVATAMVMLALYACAVSPVIEAQWRANGVVLEVVRGGNAAAAGLREGDVLLTLGDRPRTGLQRVLFAARAGEAVEAGWSRGGVAMRGTLRYTPLLTALVRRAADGDASTAMLLIQLLPLIATPLLLALGLVILANRYDDPAARISGFLFLALASGNNIAGLHGFGGLLADVPRLLAVVLAIDSAAYALIFATTIEFALLFPKRLRVVEQHGWVRGIAYVASVPILFHGLARSRSLRGLPPSPFSSWASYADVAAPLLLMAALALIAWRLRRREPDLVRRQAKTLLFSLAPGTIALTLSLFVADRVVGALIVWIGMLVGSALYAWVVMRHGLLGFRVLARRWLQYALARGTAIVVISVPAIALVVHAVLAREKPREYLHEHGVSTAIFFAAAVVLLAMRKRILGAVDRHFFRTPYDVQSVLLNVVTASTATHGFAAVFEAVAKEIDAALHPSLFRVFLEDEASGRFVDSTPGATLRAIDPLPSDSALARLLVEHRQPLSLEAIVGRLTDAERGWVERSGCELLVPLREGTRRGFLILGRMRSERPYTSADRELLYIVAAQLALLATSGVAAHDEARLCTACGGCYPPAAEICAFDEQRLVRAGVPYAIDEKYELDRLLGEGGMGKVFRARQRNLPRRVALKVLPLRLAAEPGMRERFQHEATLLAALRHPGIVTIYDYGVLASGEPYIAMEYVEGTTLRQRLSEGPLVWDEFLRVVNAIGAAVASAHDHGIIHRDLKPENVIIPVDARRTDDGDAKVLDFGIAKLRRDDRSTLSPHTDAGVLLGTPRYMAPELFRGAPADEHSDQYALGVIAYEMAAGAHPFHDAEMLREIIHAHTHSDVPPLPRAELRDLYVVLARAMAKDRTQRHATLRDFLAALNAATSSELEVASVVPSADQVTVALLRPASDQKHVLIVDDEHAIRFSLSKYLSKRGWAVDVAVARQDAESLIGGTEYDLLIADLRLTGLAGAEGLDIIRSARNRSDSTKIILLTAYGSPEVQREATARGANVILVKPQPLSHLADVARELVTGSAILSS